MSTEYDEKMNGLRFDLFAFDLDGTILRHNLVISDRTMDALRQLRERGMRIVVATGRHYESAREQASRLEYGGSEPLICYGGAMIRSIDGETLLHRTMTREDSIKVLDWAQERDLHARIFLDGCIVSDSHSANLLEDLGHPETLEVSVVDSPADWLRKTGENPTKIVFIDYPKNVGGWLEEANDAFAGRLFVTRSLPHYVEVAGLEGTKSRALKFLCERWGIEAERVAAFGDAENDIDMLQFAGCGIAVGGMNQGIRDAADEVVAPVDEDGVACYIESLLEDA